MEIPANMPPIPAGWRLITDPDEHIIAGAKYWFATNGTNDWRTDVALRTEDNWTPAKIDIRHDVLWITPITEPALVKDKEWLNPWD